ncbi:LAS seventeen-binding protein 3 [Seminavis robusta]|uniref:LAS seventeen-binding protein 3 n=1 Tax=Seminavis robusta TaxID=568900 RepID=A0A9N8H3B5_9STRA|nr:LAS seventeen-binding protein 3 [Seminavis robusta]|eukprot:Sro56_g032820.1 LAS seventeen-binding protein 3 (272) ;mRNA; r:76884-77840
MSQSTIRPDRLSMEGMIWNANHVLEMALDPKQQGIPKGLFEKSIGLCIISVVEAGFIFSGNVGTGILLKKKADGSWSNPCAMGLGGVGWGLLVGAAVKDIIIFIFDENSMNGMMGEVGLRIGGQVNLTPGPFGRNYEAGVGVTTKGAVGTCSVAFSQGLFGSISIEGAMVGVRGGANDQFYNKVTNPHTILNTEELTLPENRPTLMESVYKHIAKLEEGNTHTPTEEETLQAQIAAKVAQEASEEMAQADPSGVLKVDAAEEAEKEKAASS